MTHRATLKHGQTGKHHCHEKCIALIASFAVNGLFGIVLHRSDLAYFSHETAGEKQLLIIWIERYDDAKTRTPTRSDDAPAVDLPAVDLSEKNANGDLHLSGIAPSNEQSVVPPPIQIVDGDDMWVVQEKSSGYVFPSPAERIFQQAPAITQNQYSGELPMRDTSFGGRLASMTRRTNCAELKNALRRNPESSNVIIKTMERMEC